VTERVSSIFRILADEVQPLQQVAPTPQIPPLALNNSEHAHIVIPASLLPVISAPSLASSLLARATR
jgi:hypothetical protein